MFDSNVYLHVLGQNDFISKALTTNYTNVFPLADVDLMVPAAEVWEEMYKYSINSLDYLVQLQRVFPCAWAE